MEAESAVSAALAAPTILLLTLYLVLARPRNLDTGLAALIGALLALMAGVITLADVRTVAGIVWDATFALIAIVIISIILDQAGLFRWAALWLARFAGGDGRRIFVAMVLLGVVVSTLFTNDATVLILTPIMYEMLTVLGFSHRMLLPYMIACGFVADSMSIPLAVSNLTNMIVVRYFDISFGRFALLMLIPSLFCLAASLLVLFWYYRREIPVRYDQAMLANPHAAIRDPFLFRVGGWVMVAMILAFFLNSAFTGVPVSFIIAVAAAVLLLATLRNRIVRPVKVLRQGPWHVVVFAMGMYLVVFGLGNAGLTSLTAGLLTRLAEGGLAMGILGTGFVVAILSSTMNNLPGVMLGSMAVEATQMGGALHEGMVMANVIGAGVGPKLTPIGSLATLIWLHGLQQKGLQVTWQYYLKVGLVITPPVLLAALVGLWLSMRIFG